MLRGAQEKQIERVTKLLGSDIQARERLPTSMTASLKEMSVASELLVQRLGRVESKMSE